MPSEPYLGELMLTGFDYAPKGWAFCEGQIIAIAPNQALFSLIGTTFGGNGTTTFGLPDLRGRIALGSGQGPGISAITRGQVAGQEVHTLTIAEMPSHNHGMMGDGVTPANNNAFSPAPGNSLGMSVGQPTEQASVYDTGTGGTLAAGTISTVGGQPHENRQPYLAMRWCIALTGIFPSRN